LILANLLQTYKYSRTQSHVMCCRQRKLLSLFQG